MHTRTLIHRVWLALILFGLLLPACGNGSSGPARVPAVTPTDSSSNRPAWFDIELTDAQTGQTFTINDFAGKVVLVETMAEWCPNCRVQQNEMKKLHSQMGNPPDLISISLDVDPNEDVSSLKNYVASFNYDWRFAVAPLLVARALGNLYSAEYLNPPLTPMLLIDREGNVYSLPYGFKSADALQNTIEPYLK